MSKMLLVLGAGALCILTGCKTVSEQEPVPARISSPSAESTTELTRIVSTVMDGKSVKIAPTALTESNELVIMENTKSMLGNDPINGMIRTRPQRFLLMKRGNACYLVHKESGEEYVLQQTPCEPL